MPVATSSRSLNIRLSNLSLSSTPTKPDSPYLAQLSLSRAPDLHLYLVCSAAQATPNPPPLLLMAAQSQWYHQPVLPQAPWPVPVDMTHHPSCPGQLPPQAANLHAVPCSLHAPLARLLRGLKNGGCECLPAALQRVGVEFPDPRKKKGAPEFPLLPGTRHIPPTHLPLKLSQLRRIHRTSRAHMTFRATWGPRLGKGGKSDTLFRAQGGKK